MPETIRIATRKSPLALWQANHVADRLRDLAPGRNVELVTMTTAGDRWLHTPLSQVGGKGLFIKELEQALYDGRADLAVHSMKDVTAHLPEGLEISTVLEREDPFDAFVSNDHEHLDALPHGAVVGTSSLRRQSQLKAVRPDLVVRSIRGNVNSRLAKLDAGEFAAILLACAGLKRLGFETRIRHAIDARHSLPAVGQGIVGVEIRSDDTRLKALLSGMHHRPSAIRLAAERGFNATLDGGCSAPVAGYSTIQALGQELQFTGRVLSIDGQTLLEDSAVMALQTDAIRPDTEITDTERHARTLGIRVAETLLGRGARALLDEAAARVAADAQAAGVLPEVREGQADGPAAAG